MSARQYSTSADAPTKKRQRSGPSATSIRAEVFRRVILSGYQKMTKKVWLNNRVHIVDDELYDHVEELRERNMKLEIQITNARKVVQNVSDALDRVQKKIEKAFPLGYR